MNRYECEYNGKIRRYTGVTAMEAVYKLARQNHVTVSVAVVDSKTMGVMFARGWVYKGDKNRGEWVDMRIVNTMKEVA